MIASLLEAISAACKAYVVYVNLKREERIDDIEDKIDDLSAIGDATSKLRLRRLLLRKKRYIEQLGSIRPTTDTPD